ncbi:diguanylate cyclase [bacterium]|nr:diguanylate cyclase [bacterium]
MTKLQYSILYVEDETGVRENISQSLRMKYRAVFEAADAKMAYEIYKEKKPDLILTDIQLLKGNGLDFCTKVRQENLHIPIIVTSAYSDREKLLQAVSLNLTDYMVKPISRTSLQSALDKAVEKLNYFGNVSRYDELLEAIIIINEAKQITYCNTEAVLIFGYSDKKELLALKYDDLLLEGDKKTLNDLLENRISVNEKIYLKRKDASLFIANILFQNSVGRVDSNQRVISILDITKSIKEHSRDTLTKLYTRSILELEFNTLMAQSQGEFRQVGAIFVDIDNFKIINDRLGHQFGDRVIQTISNVLSRGIRKSDLLVRWGGDEFLILLFDTSLEDTKKSAESLRTTINAIEFEGHSDFSCSFGIDKIHKNDTLEALTSRIDKALLEAKNISKNSVVAYSSIEFTS